MNNDTPEAKAFRDAFKADIMRDPQAAYDAFLASAEDATNSPDPVIANKGWERIRELVVLSAILAGAHNPAEPVDTDAIAAKVKADIQSEIDALAKSKDDDFAALSQRITSLETPLEPSPVDPNKPAS